VRSRWISTVGFCLGVATSTSGCHGSDEAPAPALTKLEPAAPPVPGSTKVAELDLGPRVTLDGESRGLPATLAKGGPRIYGRDERAWIYEAPRSSANRLGYLRAGSSSPTQAEPVGKQDCAGGWYPVEPRGFVCAGPDATLDANDPAVSATREHPPEFSRKLPYIYGTVRNPGPIYDRLPTREQVERAESDYEARMQRWLEADGEIGAGYAQSVWSGGLGDVPDPKQAWLGQQSDALPAFLASGKHPNAPNASAPDLVKSWMRPRVGHSFLETLLFQGRRYGLTTGQKWMPTDRLRPIQGSDFHGVRIGKDIELPFVFVRQPDAHFWQYEKGKKLIDAGAAPYRGAIRLSGKQQFFRGRLHYETIDQKWISDADASRLDPAKRMPAWGKNGEKWIDVNLTKQTLMLYEGTKPVYATLISSGEAGLEDPEHSTATKRGIFRIHTKHASATMSSDEAGEEFELQDVPYVQYFDKAGYALHGAYWHDRFGIPKSHGCINLAPEDARRIFFWTKPDLPIGWHGVLQPLTGTVLFIHP
jgi:hypothetical protein